MRELTDAELDRYQRQIILPDIGGRGQTLLANAHVLVIGAGGIGCPALAYLAAGGIGRITLFDDDVVDLSNLQRQILFSDSEIGEPKAESAAKWLHKTYPGIPINHYNQKFTAQHKWQDDIRPDVLIDGTDSFASRLAINDWAVANRVPLVSAAIGQFQGQLGVFRGYEPDQPCYRCFVGDAFDSDDCDTCAENGVLGAMVGMMGCMAAMEAVRVITGFGSRPANSLQIIDGKTMTMRSITLHKDPDCKTCGDP
ncbi:HesA/MoeB/ThiF family protein [Alterisphingorhabdus coralli]|uniref:HesA/MoeB/ThiF family protein n=1 Tax=Alterisphingorhabdus coralli TaxID=3071408 RepID=A0AA97F8J3_9SPHN|nr:HesA/MoeB/ThiF family protein [Parasphingorhabdus sp. SCSIO 66989]WOE75012.1 HesA/MoeB/ThiF family protein [Parasphingorhabdus sp. SCSIO 66989]